MSIQVINFSCLVRNVTSWYLSLVLHYFHSIPSTSIKDLPKMEILDNTVVFLDTVIVACLFMTCLGLFSSWCMASKVCSNLKQYYYHPLVIHGLTFKSNLVSVPTISKLLFYKCSMVRGLLLYHSENFYLFCFAFNHKFLWGSPLWFLSRGYSFF